MVSLSLSSLAIGLFALGLPQSTVAEPTHPRDFSIKAREVSVDEHQDTPFKGFNGCNDFNKKRIVRGWFDVIEIIRGISDPERFEPEGVLEKRFFGDDIKDRPQDIGFITNVFARMFQTYSDQIHGEMLISCQDEYQPLKRKEEQNRCDMKFNNDGRKSEAGGLSPGAYAFNTGARDLGNQVIVICPGTAAKSRGSLADYLNDARKDPEDAQDPKEMAGMHRTLLHELLHLNYFSDTDQVVIEDLDVIPQDLLPGQSGTRAYGIENVEKKGSSKYGHKDAHKNADTLTWYAIEKFYSALFGTTRSVTAPAPRDGTGEILNIVLSSQDDQSGPELVWHNEYLFYQVPRDHDSSCDSQEPVGKGGAPDGLMDEPVPGGTYKVNIQDKGECEYKNDGTNPGAVWCGDTSFGCEWAKDRGTSFVCPEIAGKSRSNVVTCSLS